MYLAAAVLFEAWPAVLFAQADWLYRPAGLEKFDGSRWQPADPREYGCELEELIDEFVSEVRVPFDLPAGTEIVVGEDDKELTKERTLHSCCILVGYDGGRTPPPDTKLAHGGVDVGSRITRDGGRTLEKLGNAPVLSVHAGGFLRSDGVFVEQKIICQQGPLRLIVLLKYGHVVPTCGIRMDWWPTPVGFIGRLEGRDSWKSLDPALSTKMGDKGNHIHLVVEGIYDLDAEALIAHSEQMKGRAISQEHKALLDRRARFFNEALLPKITKRK